MQNKYTIRLETKSDYNNAENLTREAFWNVYRPGCLEHYVLQHLSQQPVFCSGAGFCDGAPRQLIGHVMYVRSEIRADDGRTIPIMTFGPSALHRS
jgi:predicted N-acetyltransferase YhbS